MKRFSLGKAKATSKAASTVEVSKIFKNEEKWVLAYVRLKFKGTTQQMLGTAVHGFHTHRWTVNKGRKPAQNASHPHAPWHKPCSKACILASWAFFLLNSAWPDAFFTIRIRAKRAFWSNDEVIDKLVKSVSRHLPSALVAYQLADSDGKYERSCSQWPESEVLARIQQELIGKNKNKNIF